MTKQEHDAISKEFDEKFDYLTKRTKNATVTCGEEVKAFLFEQIEKAEQRGYVVGVQSSKYDSGSSKMAQSLMDLIDKSDLTSEKR